MNSTKIAIGTMVFLFSILGQSSTGPSESAGFLSQCYELAQSLVAKTPIGTRRALATPGDVVHLQVGPHSISGTFVGFHEETHGASWVPSNKRLFKVIVSNEGTIHKVEVKKLNKRETKFLIPAFTTQSGYTCSAHAHVNAAAVARSRNLGAIPEEFTGTERKNTIKGLAQKIYGTDELDNLEKIRENPELQEIKKTVIQKFLHSFDLVGERIWGYGDQAISQAIAHVEEGRGVAVIGIGNSLQKETTQRVVYFDLEGKKTAHNILAHTYTNDTIRYIAVKMTWAML